jgi:hypothetical protein
MSRIASKNHTVMPARAIPSMSAAARSRLLRDNSRGRVIDSMIAAAAIKRSQVVALAPISIKSGRDNAAAS